MAANTNDDKPREETTTQSTNGDIGSNKKSTLRKYKDYFTAAVTTDGVIGLIKDKKITLKNIIVGFISFGLERLISSKVFDCPVKDHGLYADCFLYVPAFLLFCANLLIIGEVWQLSGRCFIKRYRRRGDVVARLIPSGIVKAMVGPAAWLIACFANGDYYLCATVGPGVAKRNLTDTEIQTLEEQLAAGKAQSHILAWVVVGIMTALGAIVIITKNCFLKDDLLLKNLYIFERREAAAALFAFQKIVRGEDVDQPTEENKKITLNLGDDDEFDIYLDGIPEKTGRENAKKIFQEVDSDYIKAYEKFRKLYPRVANGNPASPWRAVHDKTCAGNNQHTFMWCCKSQEVDSNGIENVELDKLITTQAD